MIVVGIDVGGTFTDIAAVDEETGTVSLAKVPSTPQDEARAVLKGLAELGVAPQPRPWPRQSTRRAVSSGVPTSRLWHPGSAAPGPERGGAMGFDEKVDRGAAVTFDASLRRPWPVTAPEGGRSPVHSHIVDRPSDAIDMPRHMPSRQKAGEPPFVGCTGKDV